MQRLRDAVEDKRIYNISSTDDLNTLTSSMDALEDTHDAISAFVAAGSKLAPKYQERELGERYLRTYGVMQAFVIQQDAAQCPPIVTYGRARLEALSPYTGLE